MPDKLIGYILLVTGIMIMFFSGVSVYQVFTKQTKPVQLFSFSGVSLDLNQMLAGSLPAGQISQLPKSPQAQIIAPEMLNDTSNLFAHLMLMGFLVSLGYKIATLGTYLMRSIKVNLKTDNPQNKSI